MCQLTQGRVVQEDEARAVLQVLFYRAQLRHVLNATLLQQVPCVALQVVKGAVRRLADACGAGLAALLGTAGHLGTWAGTAQH